jgi:site-specific DNA-methyltransferase (adenine-specific)/adenine-specific DNA-methyltransferase
MTEEQRQELIRLLQQEEDISPEWARIVFPPEKREYELVYHGKVREEDIIADTLAVPLQPVRTFGGNGSDWHNMLIFGDNLQVMKTLLELKKDGKLCNADGTMGARLIYIDPPFGTGDEYGTLEGEKAYSAKMKGSLFIEFLRRRLVFLRELMADDGSLFVRIDYHFRHYVKVLLDELLLFRNEIIINRIQKKLTNLKRFNVSTEALLFYSKSDNFVFKNPPAPLGMKMMAVFIDIYGNEARVLIDKAAFNGKKTDKQGEEQ